MKKQTLLSFCLLVAIVATSYGQFEKAMGRSIPAMFSADNPENLQGAINQLSRIGEAEGDRWEPYYYVAFGYLRMSQMMETLADKDKYLDLALTAIDNGDKVQPNDSELETMRGYINMMKLSADPGTRGATYSGLVFGSFQKAIQLNPDNPRAHFLLGQMQKGTAQFMGGTNDEACASFSRALELFENGGNANPLAPNWGKEGARGAIKQNCEG